MIVEAKITLHERRCWECGQWWASEHAVHGVCPNCAQQRIDNAFAQHHKLERTIAALKGALTRKRIEKGAASS